MEVGPAPPRHIDVLEYSTAGHGTVPGRERGVTFLVQVELDRVSEVWLVVYYQDDPLSVWWHLHLAPSGTTRLLRADGRAGLVWPSRRTR